MYFLFGTTPHLLFGAGGTQGGVKRVGAVKINYINWYLKDATRDRLQAIHHPLVTEYLIRLNEKRKMIERYQEESIANTSLAPLVNKADGSLLDLARWNALYKDEIDLSAQMSEFLIKLNDNIILQTNIQTKGERSENDAELLDMINEDIADILKQITSLDNPVNSIMEKRLASEDVVGSSSRTWNICVAGKAGGEEAGLFAGELAEMFKLYAKETLGLQVDTPTEGEDSISTTGHRFQLTGEGIYRNFHHEIGVHKVQRVPVTDAAGKMQTSTAVFTMMPVLDPVAVNVHESDCNIDYVRGSGPGGQGMQSSSNCCVLTHRPSGISVKCHQSRSALGNKELALQMVAQKILSQKVRSQNSSLHDSWESQWSSGERSDKMRTYNYPQNRVTDHRLGKDYSLVTFMERGAGLREVHASLNDLNDRQELVRVLLKHIEGEFSSTTREVRH